jgi:hypothetical protein
VVEAVGGEEDGDGDAVGDRRRSGTTLYANDRGRFPLCCEEGSAGVGSRGEDVSKGRKYGQDITGFDRILALGMQRLGLAVYVKREARSNA